MTQKLNLLEKNIQMVLEIIRYVIADGQENQFETDYGKAAQYLDSSPHCLGYKLARSGKEKIGT